MQRQPGSGRGTRLSLLGVGLLLLLAIVAFASRSGIRPRAAAGSDARSYVSYAMTVFVILFVLMIPVAVYAFMHRLRDQAESRSNKSLKARVRLGAALVGSRADRLRRRSTCTTGTPTFYRALNPFRQASHEAPRRTRPEPRRRPTRQFQWPVLWIALALLAADRRVRLLPLDDEHAGRSNRRVAELTVDGGPRRARSATRSTTSRPSPTHAARSSPPMRGWRGCSAETASSAWRARRRSSTCAAFCSGSPRAATRSRG